MKRIDKEKVEKIIEMFLVIGSILLMALVCVGKNTQNDLFFDLKTGESILKYGIDFQDHFSFIPNLTYMYHHYLYDLIVYGIYNLFSYAGIFLFFLVVVTLLGLGIYHVNLNLSKSKIYALIITFITLFLCHDFLVNRVQTITYIFFGAEVYFLNKLYETGKNKYLIYILVLSIIIVNIHMPLWILTIVLVFPFLVEALVANLKIKIPFLNSNIKIKEPKNLNKILLTFLLLIVTGLCSPLKLYPYIFFIKALGNNDFLFINEMARTVPIVNKYFLIILLLSLGLLILLKVKVKLRDVLLILGLSLFSLMAVRNIAYIYIIFPTVLGKIIYENYLGNLKIKLPKIFNYINYDILKISVLVFIGFVSYSASNSLNIKNYDYKINEDYPVELVKYYKENYDYKNLKIFNEFNFGSYLEFNDIPVFVDSRAEVYIQAFNGGYDIIGDYLKTSKYIEYKKIFNKYDFDCAIIYRDSALDSYLRADKDYRLVFEENDTFALYEKVSVKM